ncbi:MAG: extracellular solute-binding protein [Sporichthyaceae bacterium]
MPTFETEDHYLASLVPPSTRVTSAITNARLGRRGFLKGAAGTGAALSLPALLAACGGSSDTGSTGGSGSAGATGTVTIGSNASDDVPKKAFADVFAAFETAKPKLKTKVNTVDHNTFQEQINNYLQGSPDDLFTWFAGYRMRFFASQGLAGDITDVWDKVGGDFSDSFKKASTGDDGKQYFMPIYNYPWVLMYRKSVFSDRGYTAPTTMDELTTLGDTMKSDGLDPIAFADKDGWPAMGTFDILNMRTNGYDFHVSLMAGKESWQDAKVKQVFSTWASLLPYHQSGSLGRTWQEAAQALVSKKAGMYLLGTFASQQFTDPADLEDLDFVAFPSIASEHGTDSIDAPIDGFMMSSKPKNEAGAKALLEYLSTAEAENIYLKTDPGDVGANSNVDTSGYNAVQAKSAEIIGATKNIAQFLDRDTRPDFASTVMIPALQDFIKNPKDIDGLTSSIENQKKSIFV